MLNEKIKNGLIIGIGNSGREDDGLGWYFLDAVQQSDLDCDVEYRYQLQIEDAELISRYKNVLFVDAIKSDDVDSFALLSCFPSGKHEFSTHELRPETVLYLAETLYKAKPKAHVLAIRGYQWGLRNGLSLDAFENLEKAVQFFLKTKLVN